MIGGGTTVTDSTPQQVPVPAPSEAGSDHAWEEVRASLRNLRYGSVTIIVQDGVIIQIDRTEKRRLQSRRSNHRGQ
jgi:hypothetical protein